MNFRRGSKAGGIGIHKYTGHQQHKNNMLKLKFAKDKETKNTIRFQEVVAKKDDRPKVGTLYVLKDLVGVAEAVEITLVTV